MSEDGWLFECWRPGFHSAYVSVDPNDNSWWPKDQWKSVSRTPMKICGEPELLWGDKLPPGSVTHSAGDEHG